MHEVSHAAILFLTVQVAVSKRRHGGSLNVFRRLETAAIRYSFSHFPQSDSLANSGSSSPFKELFCLCILLSRRLRT